LIVHFNLSSSASLDRNAPITLKKFKFDFTTIFECLHVYRFIVAHLLNEDAENKINKLPYQPKIFNMSDE
jgi:hypothetical protein